MNETLLQPDIIATVCYPLRTYAGHEEMLLAFKGRTKQALALGIADKWNGYGGKKEITDPSIDDTCTRELQEESKLEVKKSDIERVGKILFVNPGRKNVLVYFFFARNCHGTPVETEEMTRPTWYPVSRIPIDDMPDADKHFVPVFISGRKLEGTVWHDEHMKFVRSDIQIVTSIAE